MLAEHLVSIFNTPLHSFGQPFIVSFCEDGDLLSQWRAYGQASGFRWRSDLYVKTKKSDSCVSTGSGRWLSKSSMSR